MSTSADAAAAAGVFQAHRDELGFVNRAQCAEKDLVVERRGGEIVGALLGNHCVRKSQSTVYELAVLPDHRREGIARLLVDRFAAESPHARLVAKCPADLPANDFYRDTGWSHVDTEAGKNRPLNVWQRTHDGVDVYMTTQGGEEAAEAIAASPARVGIETSHAHKWPIAESPSFIDWPFTDPDAGYAEHLALVGEHNPALTVAPDVEAGRSLDAVVEKADELAKHADDVIVVPKECHPSDVPDRHRVGLTTGRFGSMAPWSVWEYRDAGPVHILGGSPAEQQAVARHVEVASCDSFSLGRRARYGEWADGAIDCPDGAGYGERLRRSLTRYWRWFNNV
jgi:GNAT superfamily N-acetyltransferase